MADRKSRMRTLGAISISTSLSSIDFDTLPIRPPVVTSVSPRRTFRSAASCSRSFRARGRITIM